MLKLYTVLCFILSFYLGTCQFEEFKSLAEMIIECGENVRRVIQKPEYDSRYYVIRELAKYYHLLDHVDEKFRYKDHDAMEILQTVYNQGGPPHLNIDLDYEALQKRYKFKEGGMRDIRTLMNDTKDLWEKLVNLLREEKNQAPEKQQKTNQEDATELRRGQVDREDVDGRSQFDFTNSVGGVGDVNTEHINEEDGESRGQIDLIANRDNEEEDAPSGKTNNEDRNERGEQIDWFNEEK